MENYELKNDETILYRGSVTYMPKGKKGDKENQKCDLLLTNLSIVLSFQKKKMFKTTTEVSVYAVSDVKFYNDAVQVIRKKAVVDVYLKNAELFLDFEKEAEAKNFCEKALRLISGYSKLVRSVKKAQKAVDETNEALDINIGEMTKKTAVFAAEVVMGVGAIKGAGEKTKFMGKIAETILNVGRKKKKNNDAELEEPRREIAEIEAPKEETEENI